MRVSLRMHVANELIKSYNISIKMLTKFRNNRHPEYTYMELQRKIREFRDKISALKWDLRKLKRYEKYSPNCKPIKNKNYV